GAGTVPLIATRSSGDSLWWFSSTLSQTLLANGSNVPSPTLYGNTTFYAQNADVVVPPSTFQNSNIGPTAVSNVFNMENGWTFNVTPNKDLTIDNIHARMVNTNSATFKVYYRVGSYAGFTTSPSAWT